LADQAVDRWGESGHIKGEHTHQRPRAGDGQPSEWLRSGCNGGIYQPQPPTFYRDAEDTYLGIKDVDIVLSLSAQNMECITIGKDFMFSHGYIKHDFDVDAWAAPEFLGQAATEVLKEEWERRSWTKLPEGGGLKVEGTRLG
jgi:hypothetical protein